MSDIEPGEVQAQQPAASEGAPNARRLRLAFADASRDLAAPFARSLEAAGFDVDWAQLSGAQADAAVDRADAVIVCWTPAAVASDAVNLEAARARRARKLVHVVLAPCSPPASLGGRLETSDLSGWRGDPSDADFLAIVHSLHARFAGRIISGEFWRSRLFSWGGAGALSVAAITILVNFGSLRQTFDGLFNPAASERALGVTDAKIDEVLALIRGGSSMLDPGSEDAMRGSISKLMSAQTGERGRAAIKLTRGDIEGARADLEALAAQGETAAADLAETWSQIGALAYSHRTWDAIHAYSRAVELSPADHEARSQLGYLYTRVGNLEGAVDAFAHVYSAVDFDDPSAFGPAAGNLGMALMRQGDHEQARVHLLEALEAGARAQDDETIGYAESDLGELAAARGDLDEAEQRFARAASLHAKTGNAHAEATAIALSGQVMRDRGRLDRAEAALERALATFNQLSDPGGAAFVISSMGEVAMKRGDVHAARALFTEALELSRSISSNDTVASSLVRLGEISAGEGDVIAAIEAYREARDLYAVMGFGEPITDLEARMDRLGATPAPEGPEN